MKIVEAERIFYAVITPHMDPRTTKILVQNSVPGTLFSIVFFEEHRPNQIELLTPKMGTGRALGYSNAENLARIMIQELCMVDQWLSPTEIDSIVNEAQTKKEDDE